MSVRVFDGGLLMFSILPLSDFCWEDREPLQHPSGSLLPIFCAFSAVVLTKYEGATLVGWRGLKRSGGG